MKLSRDQKNLIMNKLLGGIRAKCLAIEDEVKVQAKKHYRKLAKHYLMPGWDTSDSWYTKKSVSLPEYISPDYNTKWRLWNLTAPSHIEAKVSYRKHLFSKLTPAQLKVIAAGSFIKTSEHGARARRTMMTVTEKSMTKADRDTIKAIDDLQKEYEDRIHKVYDDAAALYDKITLMGTDENILELLEQFLKG